MNNILVCPHGRHSDKIDKVSYIYKSQTRTREVTEWVYETYRDNEGREQSFSYPRSYDVVEITNLAKQLSPPEKPEVHTDGAGRELAVRVGILFISLLAICVISTTYIFENRTLCIASVIGAMFLVFIIMNLRSSAGHKKDLAQVQNVKIPRWKRAMTKWNQLYYCAQHDIIFNPYEEAGATMPVPQMTQYLDS